MKIDRSAVKKKDFRPVSQITDFAEAGVSGVVKIEIMDTGIGISKEGVKKLFKPYQQADASISQYLLWLNACRNYGGTGLGLWISKSIIKLMGGDIEVPSLHMSSRLNLSLEEGRT